MSRVNRDLLKAFAQALRAVRRRRGYAQERLALDAGLSRGHLSDLERGLREPRLGTLVKLCEVLDTPLPVLAREIESNYRRLLEKS